MSIKERKTFLAIALIIIAGLVVYVNSVNGKFIWDDEVFVKHNRYIKSWTNVSKTFTEDPGAGGGGYYGFFRPLQMITYMVDYTLWGLDVRAYHFVNIALHVLVALALYWLINSLFCDRILSLFASLMFVVHPVHTEAISYISGRGDPLAALFMLLCFIFYIEHQRSRNTRAFIFMILSYILALFSKENSLILPALLLLYHYSFKEKLNVKGFLSIIILIVMYIFVRMTAAKTQLPYLSYLVTLPRRIPGFFVAITNYLRLIFLPFDLHMEYGGKLFSITHPKAIFGGIMLLSLLAYAFKKRKNSPLVLFSISWFLIALLPSSNIYPPIAFYMAEHYLYWPSIGFFLILAGGLNYIYKTKNTKAIALILLIGICGFYSYLTIKQNEYWSDRITFYKRTLKYAPESSRLYNNLADIYMDTGKNQEAIALLEKGSEVNPSDAYVYNNLGRAYTSAGRYAEAIAVFKRAIEINPNLAEAYNNLAVTYYYSEKYRLAIEYLDIAVQLGHRINPELLRALNPHRPK